MDDQVHQLRELRAENQALALGLFVAGLAAVQGGHMALDVVAYVLVFALGLALGRKP